MNLPVFLMGFANDRKGNHLRGIASEQDAIKMALKFKERVKQCQLEIISDLNIKKLINSIRNYPPTVFHYGGHASGDQLFFGSDEKVNADPLADIITHFSGVELVFLNGCATKEQAKKFIQNGVHHVIVTSKAIKDKDAVEFAFQFYKGLANGETVAKAFKFASDALKTGLSEDVDTRGGFDISDYPEGIPWELVSATKKKPWKWKEPKESRWGKVKAEKRIGEGLSGVKVMMGKKVIGETDKSGIFKINIKHRLLGKSFEINVEKSNYRVVNFWSLNVIAEEDWSKDKELVEIIMCPHDKWDECVSDYINLNAVKAVNEKLKKNGIFSSAEGEQAVAQMGNVVKQLSRIDPLKADDQLKKAMHYIDRQKPEKAIKALDDEWLKQCLTEAERLGLEAKEKRQRALEFLLVKASAFIMNFEFDKAEACYEKAIKADPENISIRKDFINYLYKQKKFRKARKECENGLAMTDTKLRSGLSLKGELLHETGRILFKLNENEKAKSCFEEAFNTREELIANNKSLFDSFQKQITSSLEELAILCSGPDSFNKKGADFFFANILKVKDEMLSIDFADSEGQKASTLNNLGNLYLFQRDYKQAEKYLLKSLEIDQRLALTDPIKYRPYVAVNLNDIGELYIYDRKFEKAKNYFHSAIKIRKELADSDPAEYKPAVADTLLNLGKVHTREEEYKQALDYYEEALSIQKSFASNNPTAYNPGLSKTYHNLGRLYLKNGNHDEAKKCFVEAQTIREGLMKGNPKAYKDEYAATLTNFGILNRETGFFEVAKEQLEKARDLDIELVATDKVTFEPYLAKIYYELGLLYMKTNDFTDASAAFNKVIEIYESYKKGTGNWFDINLARQALKLVFEKQKPPLKVKK